MVLSLATSALLFAAVAAPAEPAAAPSPRHVEAIRLFHEERYDEALPRFLALLDSMVTDELLEKAALCFGSLGRSSEGDSLFRAWAGGDALPPPLSFAASFLCEDDGCVLARLEEAVRGAPDNSVYIKRYCDECRARGAIHRSERFLEEMPDTPGRLFATGYLARLQGDYARSAELLESALAAGADTVLVIGSLAACRWYLGRLDLAAERYAVACELLDRRGDWERQVPYFGSRATALMRLERYDEALPLFRRAIERAAATGQRARELDYLLSAGDTALLIGDDARADTLLERAADLSRRVANPALELAARKSRAQSLVVRGEPEEAVEVLAAPAERAVAGEVPGAAEALVILGEAYTAASRGRDGERSFRAGLAMAGEEEDAALQGRALSGLGQLALARGEPARAESLFRRAVDYSVAGGDRPGERRRRSYLALALEHAGRYQEALDIYREVLPLDCAAGDRRAVAARLSNIAAVHEYLGDYREALRFREEALDSTRLLDRPGEVTKELANIGLLYMKVGSYHRAESALREAVERAAAADDASTESHLLVYLAQLSVETSRPAEALPRLDRAVEQARASANLYSESDAWLTRGRALADLHRLEEAEESYRRAGELARRTGTPYTEWIVEFRRGDAARKRGAPEEALAHFERSIGLASTARRALAEDRYRITFQEERTRVFDASIDLLVELGRVEEAFEQAERGKARALVDLLAGAAPSPDDAAAPSATAAGMRRRMGETGERFTAFWLGETASHLWSITGEEIVHHTLPGRETIEERVRFLLDRIRRRGEWSGAASGLGDMLLGSLAGKIDSTSRLIFAPDGVLHLLPMETLTVSGFPLLHAAALRYVPSATVLRELEARERDGAAPPVDFAGFGDPAIPDHDDLEPLPHAAEEVRAVGRLFPKGRARVYTGGEATEERLLEALGEAACVHIAAHTRIDPDAPLRSAILLTPGPAGDDDGCFRVEEAANRAIAARLVVLSGCETGVGRRARGEGVLGFTRVFLGAGADGLVVSLWRVADESTALLIRDFYERMLAGADPAVALQAARRALASRRAGVYNHPWYWAPFVVIGD